MKINYKNFLLATTALEVVYPELPTGATLTPTSDLTQYLKYIFDFGMGIGFAAVIISLAVAGVLYFLAPAIPGALQKAKDRVAGSISGLLILVLFYLIITTINPHLKIFRMDGLDPIEAPPSGSVRAGVTFHKPSGCTDEKAVPYVSSISDLGDKLRNNVNSVGIKQDPANKIAYISIAYDVKNFWGKCQYINPNRECSEVSDFAASSSIHRYNFNPSGDGVYFYRKPFSKVQGKQPNSEDGFLKIPNPSGITFFKLSDISFTGESSEYNNLEHCTVPDQERDCAQYNEKGRCILKQCPKLDNQNISSIWINGDYIVMLVYFAPGDPSYGPWTYCQEYSTPQDISNQGPQNIKWDAIRSKDQNPNWVMIIPIKN